MTDGDWIESKDQSSDGIRLLQVGNIGKGVYLDKTKNAKYISRETFNRLKCTEVMGGDILISRLPDPIGRACIVPNLDTDMITAVDCTIIRVNSDKCDKHYLLHSLSSPQYYWQIDKHVVGSTRSRISRKNLQTIILPLPPLEVQRKIADVLDRASALIEKRKAQIDKLDLLIKSQFIEMFGDPVTNPKGWKKKKLSFLGELNRGISKHRPRNDPKLLGGIYPLVQTGDVANSGFYINSYSSTYSEVGLAQSKLWNKGTLCITIAANIAKTAILSFDACFPDSIVGFLPNSEINITFTYYWFCFFQKILEEQAPESAQKNINLKILNELDVIVPPISIQTQFADLVQNVETQKSLLQQSLAKLEQNYKSLMQKCFHGEIF